MTVVLNEAALARLLDSPTGPVGRRLELRAQEVTEQAAVNASGPIIGIDTGALDSGVHFEIGHDGLGMFATVSTDALSTWHGQPFSYPAYWDQNGRPWLTNALLTLLPLGWTVRTNRGLLV